MIYEKAKDGVRDETLFSCPFPDAAKTIDICSTEWMSAQTDLAEEAKISLTPLGLFLVSVLPQIVSVI